MTTPIRPSLAQMLSPQATTARPAAQPQAQPGGFSSAIAAQKSFFQQVTQPKITPPTYTAADITQATRTAQPAAPAVPAPAQADATQPIKRPGSYLNIVI